jgi:hypothetical protein
MTQAAKQNLTQGVFFASIARQFFEAAAHESRMNAKQSINQYANKCRAIEDHVMVSCKDDKALEHFRKEIKRGDTLRFANIFDLFLRMNEEERDTVERMIEAIKRGELIEVRDRVNY